MRSWSFTSLALYESISGHRTLTTATVICTFGKETTIIICRSRNGSRIGGEEYTKTKASLYGTVLQYYVHHQIRSSRPRGNETIKGRMVTCILMRDRTAPAHKASYSWTRAGASVWNRMTCDALWNKRRFTVVGMVPSGTIRHWTSPPFLEGNNYINK